VNTFWFDTFTDAFVSSAPVKTIEAEDYNYTDTTAVPPQPGKYALDPVRVSGTDTNGTYYGGVYYPEGGYFGRQGTRGVDFWDNRTSVEGNFSGYRTTDTLTMDYVGVTQGGREEILDFVHPQPPDDLVLTRPTDGQRSKYTFYSPEFSMWLSIPEYLVVRTEPGEWMNYTRSFTKTNYLVYLRCGTLGTTQVRLDLVGGDISSTNQTLTPLGIFDLPNHLMRINYAYEPLTCSGLPVVLPLEGTNTLRLTMLGTPIKDSRLLSLNYLLFVPTSALPIALMSSPTAAGPYVEDTAASIDMVSKTITVPRPVVFDQAFPQRGDGLALGDHIVVAVPDSASVAAMALPSFAQTDAWPNRPVKLLVTSVAGGETDQIARILARYGAAS